jgi:hypothetical protein
MKGTLIVQREEKLIQFVFGEEDVNDGNSHTRVVDVTRPDEYVPQRE